MNLLIHDLGEHAFPEPDGDFTVINTAVPAAPCRGCFQCWTKNPGYCVYGDAFQHGGAAMGSSERVVIVSRICYGGYSPAVKRFLDRGISDCLPFLTFRKGMTYHAERYGTRRKLTVYFYGGCSGFERETAREYVARHAANMAADAYRVFFAERLEELGEIRG